MFPLVRIVSTASRRGGGNYAGMRFYFPWVFQCLLLEHLGCYLYRLYHKFGSAPAEERQTEELRILLRNQEGFVHTTVPVEICQIVARIVSIVATTLEEDPPVVAGERRIALCPLAVHRLCIYELTCLQVQNLYLSRRMPDVEESVRSFCKKDIAVIAAHTLLYGTTALAYGIINELWFAQGSCLQIKGGTLQVVLQLLVMIQRLVHSVVQRLELMTGRTEIQPFAVRTP